MEPPSKKNVFEGMSTLREAERARQPPSEQAKALQAYLKRYTDGDDGGAAPKKKRKKKPAAPGRAVTIIDGDASGFKAVEAAAPGKRAKPSFEVDAGEASDDDAPVIANPEEAELYKRLVEKERSGAAMQNWTSADDVEQSGGHRQGGAARCKRQRHDSPDASPPRRQRHDSPDASPPRKQRHDSPDASPPRRQRHDSPDASPPRRQRHDSPDASPPRRQRHDSPDASPPRRQRQQSPDASPPRRQREPSSDASPPRRPQQGGAPAPPAVKAAKIATGMVTGAALTAQLEQKKAAEAARFAQLEAQHGSRHAQTVYRDRETGRRMSQAEYEAAQQAAAEKKKAVYEKPEWGGGLKQMRARGEAAEALQREAARPFARTLEHVDEDLNLKDAVRFGDPMAHLVKQKAAAPPPPAIPAALARQMRKSGFVVPQEVPAHSWLKRKLGPPPNRYAIQPGRHWDGVDRSTGFERELFKQQAARAALEREARMWSQQDM